jgi:predicted ATPase/transcriptional regulator with XRE-family HTH domain
VDAEQTGTFGELLRRHRRAAELTQEDLAERAGISPRSISELERGGSHVPRRDTVALLAQALALSADERTHLEGTLAPRRRSPRLPASAAWRTPSRDRGWPPTALTPLLGRQRELEELAELLCGPARHARLVTITGPGGVGKTRLALELASQLTDRYADGVAFVPLAAVGSAELVPASIADALGVTETTGVSLGEALVAFVQPRHMLLVLDNLEHLTTAAPTLVDLLGQCPHISALVTSRAALRVRGEQLFEVAPLPVPAREATLSVDELEAYPGVALFVERAQAVRSDFKLTALNAASVVGICARVAGLPLALELAAAHARLLPPDALLARLDRPDEVLFNTAQDAPARHRAVLDMLLWSYNLLSSDERTLFRRLSVFAGGCTLLAAETVCGVGGGHDSSVLAGLTSLANHSLVYQPTDVGGTRLLHGTDQQPDPRVALLELTREFAYDQLARSGEAAELHQRHAEYFLSLAERAQLALGRPDQLNWQDRLDDEALNVRTALAYSAEGRHVELGLRLAAALGEYWELRGRLTEGRQWLDQLLASADHATGLVHARALVAAASLALAQGDEARGLELAQAALAINHDWDGPSVTVRALLALALAQLRLARPDDAIANSQEALRLAEAAGDRRLIRLALARLAYAASSRGDLVAAMPHARRSLALAREAQDTRHIALALNGLSILLWLGGQASELGQLSDESTRLFEQIGDAGGASEALLNAGHAAFAHGNYPRAFDAYQRSLVIRRDRGDKPRVAISAFYAALAAHELGHLEDMLALCDESLAYELDLINRFWVYPSTLLGHAARERGDGAKALQHYRADLADLRAAAERLHLNMNVLGVRGGIRQSLALTSALVGVAALTADRGEPMQAARLLGAVAMLQSGDAGLSGTDRAVVGQSRAQAHAALGAAFDAAFQAGEALTPEQALDEGLRVATV